MTRLSAPCKSLLYKATDVARQAISVFNDPRSNFRTGNFTVLMTIAWTALLHSHFEKQKIKYYHKQPNGRYIKIDGENKAWELGESVKHIFPENDPVRKNIELFIRLRNKLEHRNLPGIDPELTGECQALVLNFENWLIENYGDKFSLIDIMFVPIQLTSARRALTKTKTEQGVIQFIKDYRSILAPEVMNSQKFSFKAFLVPKIGNHRSSSDIAIEFVKYDENNPEEMAKYEKAIVAIKEKHVPVANTDLYKPSDVIKELNKKGVNKTMNWHTAMWQKHKVRPKSDVKEKTITTSEYCVFDSAHRDYLYTPAWIDFLIKQSKQSKSGGSAVPASSGEI